MLCIKNAKYVVWGFFRLTLNTNTVNIRIPDRPVFKWSFFGHFFGLNFELSGIQIPGSTRFVRCLNGASLDRFIIKNILFMTILLMSGIQMFTVLTTFLSALQIISGTINLHPSWERSYIWTFFFYVVPSGEHLFWPISMAYISVVSYTCYKLQFFIMI
jgi:hypothetical protein